MADVKVSDDKHTREKLSIDKDTVSVEGGPNSGHSTATKCRLRAPMVPKAKRL